MSIFRFVLPVFAAAAIAATPLAAKADMWLIGVSPGLYGTHVGGPCKRHSFPNEKSGFHCTMGYGQSAYINFIKRDPRLPNYASVVCELRVWNRGSFLKGDVWDAQVLSVYGSDRPLPQCALEWNGRSNTVDVRLK